MPDETVSEHGRRALRVRVFADVPPEVAGAILPDLADLADCAAAWCVEICVQSSARPSEGHEGACLTTEMHLDYQSATIMVWPLFLGETPERRREHLIHELVHIANAPHDLLAVRARRAMEEEGASKALLQWVDDQTTTATEHAVSNVLRMLRALAPGAFAVTAEPEDRRGMKLRERAGPG